MTPLTQLPQSSAKRAPPLNFLAKGPLWAHFPAFRTLQTSSQLDDETQASTTAGAGASCTAETDVNRCSTSLNHLPPIIAPDRLSTTRVLLQDTQASVQKLSKRMDMLDTRVQGALKELELSRVAFEAGSEKIVADISDIVYKCHADHARNNEIVRRDLEQASEKITHLNALYDAQAASISSLTLASHSQANAMQSLQAQQSQVAITMASVEPITRILPAQYELATEKMGNVLHTVVQSAFDSVFEKLSARVIATLSPIVSNAIISSMTVPDQVRTSSPAKRKRDMIDEGPATRRSNSMAATMFAHTSYTTGPGVSPQIATWNSGILATASANKRRRGSFRRPATEALRDLEHHRNSPLRCHLPPTVLSDYITSSPTRRRAPEGQRIVRHHSLNPSHSSAEKQTALSAIDKLPNNSLIDSGVSPALSCLFNANSTPSSAAALSINNAGDRSSSDRHLPECTIRALTCQSELNELRSACAAHHQGYGSSQLVVGAASTASKPNRSSCCEVQKHVATGDQNEVMIGKVPTTGKRKGKANEESGPKRTKTRKPKASSSDASTKVPAKGRARAKKTTAAAATAGAGQTKPLSTSTNVATIATIADLKTTSNSVAIANSLTPENANKDTESNLSIANEQAPPESARPVSSFISPNARGNNEEVSNKSSRVEPIIQTSTSDVYPGIGTGSYPSRVPGEQVAKTPMVSEESLAERATNRALSAYRDQEGSAASAEEDERLCGHRQATATQISQRHTVQWLPLFMIDATSPALKFIATENNDDGRGDDGDGDGDGRLSAALAHINNDIDFVRTMDENLNGHCQRTEEEDVETLAIRINEQCKKTDEVVGKIIIDDDDDDDEVEAGKLTNSCAVSAAGIRELLFNTSTNAYSASGILTSGAARTKRYLVRDDDSTDVDLLFDDILD